MIHDGYDDMCPNCVTPWKCNGPHVEDVTYPQVRAAAELIWNTSRADEGTISATGANIIAAALAEAGLLADHAYCNERVDRADQRTDAARAELSRLQAMYPFTEVAKARAELAEIKAERDEAELAALREGVQALADTYSYLTEHSPEDVRHLLNDLRALSPREPKGDE